jgi:TolA-binding protein
LATEDIKSEYSDAARFYLGECLRLQKEYNSAILNYNKVKSRSTYADDALYGKGASYFYLRDYSNAIDAFSLLLKSYPQTPLKRYALYQLAISYFNNKMYQDASDTFQTFLKENPTSSEEEIRSDEALFWLARSCYELKDYRSAIQACQQLLSQFPNSEMR